MTDDEPAVVTDDMLLALYARPAVPIPEDLGEHRWWFSSPAYTHSRESSLAIIRFSRELGSPVTDILSAETFRVLVDRLVALEKRLG
jgi:hypothetical protein